MIWIDYAIIGLISISLIIGFFRGLIREALVLVTWGVATWIGFKFCTPLATFFASSIDNASIRIAIAFVLLFILTLIIGGLISQLLGTLIKKTDLTGVDRLAGLIFGFARGVIIVTLFVMLASLTPALDSSWWKASQLLPHFQTLAARLKTQIPSHVAGDLNFQ